jgi:DNA-binding MarR family transcriptional regulator
MVATTTGDRVEEIARDLFEVFTQLCLAAMRGLRRVGDLKEVEFLTLSILQEHGTMIVGDIQRQLGILPAQMSRVIRSLENRAQPLISCRINPTDKRKIDVCMTADGGKSLIDYQSVRVRRIGELLGKLSDEDQENLARMLVKLNTLLDRGLGH